MLAKKHLAENYQCNEYLSKYENGFYHDDSYLKVILPLTEASIDPIHNHLVVGHAGVDSIEFCYRINQPGIWAFYPIDNEFEKLAESIGQLIEGWLNGTITV